MNGPYSQLWQRLRAWGVYGLAGLAGLIAAWAVREHVQTRIHELEEQAQVPMVSRIVAAHDLAVGAVLERVDVAARDIPAQWAASGTYGLNELDAIEGAILAAPLSSGEPLQAVHLRRRVAEPPLSQQLAPGRRAITLPVDEISALSGMLQPGDLIDLYVSFAHEQKQITALLLQGVRVLATGSRQQDQERVEQAYSTVTLDAAPEDAVKLLVARQSGSITAILRHRQDGSALAPSVRADLASLVGLSRKPRAAPRGVAILYGDQLDIAPAASADAPRMDGLRADDADALLDNAFQGLKRQTPDRVLR